MKVTTSTDTLAPWADVHRCLSQMRTLRVVAGGLEYTGGMTIEFDPDSGRVTLDMHQATPPTKAAPVKPTKKQRGRK